MKFAALFTSVWLSVVFPAVAGTTQSPEPNSPGSFSIPNLGGRSITSNGTQRTTQVGYGRIAADAGSNTPSGIAIIGYSPGGTLISEAGVPATEAVRQGRIFAEVKGPVNTGLAIANPNDAPATINFYFTDTDGTRFGEGTYVLDAGRQISKFLNEPPFNGGAEVSGTFTFTSSLPIAAHRRHRLTGIHEPGRRVPDDHAPGRAPGHPADAIHYGRGLYGYGLLSPFRRW